MIPTAAAVLLSIALILAVPMLARGMRPKLHVDVSDLSDASVLGLARQSPRRSEIFWGLLLVTSVGGLPFLFSTDLPYVRSVVAAAAVVTAVKFADWLRGTYRDRGIERSNTRFFVWWLFAPETRWSDNPERRREAKRAGGRRLLRATTKLALCLLAAVTLPRTGLAEAPYAIVVIATCLQFYLAFSGIADMYSSIPELMGFRTAEVFNRPFFATSPGDFWSRRWNLFVARAAAQHIFFPLNGRQHRVRGTLLVFLASGVMHEYFVAAAVGFEQAKFGYMLAFFTLQGVSVVVHHLWLRNTRQRGRLKRTISIALHTAWFTCTTPLFFTPLEPLLEIGGTGFRAPSSGLLGL